MILLSAIHSSPCSIQGKSRERHEAGTGGGGRERGDETYHPARQPEAARSRRADTRVTGGSWRHVVPAVPTAQACRAPAAVVRLRDSEARKLDHRGSCR